MQIPDAGTVYYQTGARCQEGLAVLHHMRMLVIFALQNARYYLSHLSMRCQRCRAAGDKMDFIDIPFGSSFDMGTAHGAVPCRP